MSMEALTWVKGIKAGSSAAKAVLWVVADAANDCGQTFISQDAIAERCEVARETVLRALKILETAGLIIRTKRYDEKGYRTSDLMTLALCDAQSPSNPDQCDAKSPSEAHLCDFNTVSYVTESHSIPLTIPIKKDISSLAQSKSKSHNRIKTPNDTAFEALWVAYPHFPGRSIKRRAFTAWAAMSDADRSDLVGAVCTFAGSAQAKKDNGQFVKGFHLWLHDGLWRDFIAQEQPEANQSAIDWDARLNRFKADGVWLSSWGEKPTRDGCMASLALLQAHGFRKPSLRVIEGGAQ